MMQHSKFLTNFQLPAGTTTNKSFSHAENLASRGLSHELLWTFTALLGQGGLDIAWRKAPSEKKQESLMMVKDDGINSIDNKHKLTGSPAFKELKNLIITILLSNGRKIKLQ